ncbi:MAG: hypothetical protein ACREQD_09740, partial [Candidatus Binataceae bacterium]
MPIGKRMELRKLLVTGVALLAASTFCRRPLFAADGGQNGSDSVSTTSSGDHAATMDTETKSNAFREVLKQMGAGQKPEPKLWSTFVAAQNDGLKTGPKIGDKVPDFTLPDQNGKSRSLHELM